MVFEYGGVLSGWCRMMSCLDVRLAVLLRKLFEFALFPGFFKAQVFSSRHGSHYDPE